MGKKGTCVGENEIDCIQLYFLFNVKLLIDSSKMSVSAHEGLSVFADEGGAGASTSTTLTTALPSSTLRTFSASHCLVAEGWAGEPEKASQNALPSLLNSVWLAMAAAAACSFDGSFGEAGGVG